MIFEEIGRNRIVPIDGSDMRKGVESWAAELERFFYFFDGKDADWKGLGATSDHSFPRWLRHMLVILFDDALLGDFHHFPEMTHP